MLGLQRTAGNGAVAALVQRGGLTPEEAMAAKERRALSAAFFQQLINAQSGTMRAPRPFVPDWMQTGMHGGGATTTVGPGPNSATVPPVSPGQDGGQQTTTAPVVSQGIGGPQTIVAPPQQKPPELWDDVNVKDKTLAGVGRGTLNGRVPGRLSPEEFNKIVEGAKYKQLKQLDPTYVGEYGSASVATPGATADKFNTKYLTDAGRDQFRLKIESGLLLRRGDAFTTKGMESHWASAEIKASTPLMTDWGPRFEAGSAMYVMDPQGVLYAGSSKNTRFHHSSLTSGGPVAGAGELSVAGGKLTRITNSSGHYRPDLVNMVYVLSELAQQGVVLKGVTLNLKYDGMDKDGLTDTGLPLDDAGVFFEQVTLGGKLTDEQQLRGKIVQLHKQRQSAPAQKPSAAITQLPDELKGFDPEQASAKELEAAISKIPSSSTRLNDLGVVYYGDEWVCAINGTNYPVSPKQRYLVLTGVLTKEGLNEQLLPKKTPKRRW